jgi:hypothetical protein
MRLAHAKFETFDFVQLRHTTSEQAIRVMRLQPISEKLRGNRDLNRASLAGIEFNPAKPAGEDVLAKFLAQTGLYTPPFSLYGGRVEFESRH